MNQFALRTPASELIDEIDKHWPSLPSDITIDESSAYWYTWGGGRRQGVEAKLVRKIKRALKDLERRQQEDE